MTFEDYLDFIDMLDGGEYGFDYDEDEEDLIYDDEY